MNSLQLFKEKVDELEQLSDRPDTFLYLSAWDDFRGPVFLTDYHINRMRELHGWEFEKPELFVYNSLNLNPEEFREKLNNEKTPLYEDRLTKIFVTNHKELTLREDIESNLVINREYYNFIECHKDREKVFVHYFDLKIIGKKYEETQKILYFEHENIDFFEKIIMKNYFNVKYLCNTVEGCGYGGCLKSIIDVVYYSGDPHRYLFRGFAPDYVIINPEYGYPGNIFKESFEKSIFKINKYGEYINRYGTIFKIDYRGLKERYAEIYKDFKR